MECLSLLRDIVRFIGDHVCVRQAVKEIHAFLFQVLGSVEGEGRYWYLPCQDQLKIVSAMIVPLVQQYANILADKKLKLTEEHLSPLILLLSAAKDVNPVQNSDVYLAPLKFTNSSSIPNPQDTQVVDFHEKMLGLVRRFCTSATSDRIALQILSSIPKALSSCEVTMILLLEETLRTYLTHAAIVPGKTPLEKCVGIVKFTSQVAWTKITGQAINSVHLKLKGAPIVFRLLLEQELVALEERGASDNEWLSFAINVFEPVLRFSPDRHRQFEILILWFFLLELMSDRRFTMDLPLAQEKVNIFKIQLGSADMDFITKKLQITRHNLLEIDKDENTPLFLASKATFVFLHRIVSSKMVDVSAVLQTKDVSETLNVLANQPVSSNTALTFNEKYPKFFQEMKSINSSFFGLASFEVALMSTLFPIAPHIIKLIKMSEEDTEKLAQSEVIGIVVGVNRTNKNEEDQEEQEEEEEQERNLKRKKKVNNDTTITNNNTYKDDNNDNNSGTSSSNFQVQQQQPPNLPPTNLL